MDINEAKTAKAKLEQAIFDRILAYERTTGTHVAGVHLDSRTSYRPDGAVDWSEVAAVKIEVQL
jgi:hypothetical protein